MFIISASLLLFFEITFVYSNPHVVNEINHGVENNNHNNIITNTNEFKDKHDKQQLTVHSRHEIKANKLEEEEPANIVNISNQVAQYIMQFLTKYCRNTAEMKELETLFETKGLGNFLETNIQPVYSHSIDHNIDYNRKNNKLEVVPAKVNAIDVQQGHTMYNQNFDAVPYNQLETTGSQATKHIYHQFGNTHEENVIPDLMYYQKGLQEQQHQNPDIKPVVYGGASYDPSDDYGIKETEHSMPQYDYTMYNMREPNENIKTKVMHRTYHVPITEEKSPNMYEKINLAMEPKVQLQQLQGNVKLVNNKPDAIQKTMTYFEPEYEISKQQQQQQQKNPKYYNELYNLWEPTEYGKERKNEFQVNQQLEYSTRKPSMANNYEPVTITETKQQQQQQQENPKYNNELYNLWEPTEYGQARKNEFQINQQLEYSTRKPSMANNYEPVTITETKQQQQQQPAITHTQSDSNQFHPYTIHAEPTEEKITIPQQIQHSQIKLAKSEYSSTTENIAKLGLQQLLPRVEHEERIIKKLPQTNEPQQRVFTSVTSNHETVVNERPGFQIQQNNLHPNQQEETVNYETVKPVLYEFSNRQPEIPLNRGKQTNIHTISHENIDNTYQDFVDQLETFEQMKPLCKVSLTDQNYQIYLYNIKQMRDALQVWKTSGQFYDNSFATNVGNVIDGFSKENQLLLNLEEDNTVDEEYSRRTFDGSEQLEAYLKDPQNQSDFNSLDVALQHIIRCYFDTKYNEEDSPDKQQALYLYLYNMKQQMHKYQTLFKNMEWIDAELEKLPNNSNEAAIWYKKIRSLLINGQFTDMTMDHDENTNVFFTLLNLPVNQETQRIIEGILSTMGHYISNHPESKDIKFYLGKHEDIEMASFYKHLMQHAVEPPRMSTDDRRTLQVQEDETATEYDPEIATTTEMEEATTQPTIHARNIEKHNNIFREYLMNQE